MNEWKEVISSMPERPSEIDTTSSAFYVYERKDIKPYQEQDSEDNVLLNGWQYLERKIPKEQWIINTTALNKENLDALMLGLTDLYELQLEELGE